MLWGRCQLVEPSLTAESSKSFSISLGRPWKNVEKKEEEEVVEVEVEKEEEEDEEEGGGGGRRGRRR